MSRTVLVLVMHGMTPTDFPPEEKKEFLQLRARFTAEAPRPDESTRRRHDELEHKMRVWPRTSLNDSFYFASCELASELERECGMPVILGFNEFCAPGLEDAFHLAAGHHPGQVIVTTPMVTRGGVHSEHEIPKSIAAAAKLYPAIRFDYAWPFPTSRVAELLGEQVRGFIYGLQTENISSAGDRTGF